MPDTIESRITAQKAVVDGLITEAENKTGVSFDNLPAAVEELIDGYHSGGASMNFEHIISFTTTENVRAVVIDKDKNGNSFKLDRMIIIATIPTLGVSTGYGMPKVNRKGWAYLSPSSGWDNATFSVEIQNLGSHIIAKFTKYSNNGGSDLVNAHFDNSAFAEGIVSFTWQNFNGDAEHYITAGAKFDVWGIKK